MKERKSLPTDLAVVRAFVRGDTCGLSNGDLRAEGEDYCKFLAYRGKLIGVWRGTKCYMEVARIIPGKDRVRAQAIHRLLLSEIRENNYSIHAVPVRDIPRYDWLDGKYGESFDSE